MLKIVNLTPHLIEIRLENGEKFIGNSQGNARVSCEEKEFLKFDGIPLRRQTFGAVEGLPEPKEETIFIVSAMVRLAVPSRTDVFSPDSGKTAIRENGQIVAVTGLIGN